MTRFFRAYGNTISLFRSRLSATTNYPELFTWNLEPTPVSLYLSLSLSLTLTAHIGENARRIRDHRRHRRHRRRLTDEGDHLCDSRIVSAAKLLAARSHGGTRPPIVYRPPNVERRTTGLARSCSTSRNWNGERNVAFLADAHAERTFSVKKTAPGLVLVFLVFLVFLVLRNTYRRTYRFTQFMGTYTKYVSFNANQRSHSAATSVVLQEPRTGAVLVMLRISRTDCQNSCEISAE